MIRIQYITFLFVLLNITSSCVSYNELVYFREDPTAMRQIDSTALEVKNSTPIEIQKYDVLAITVRSFEQALATPFNTLESSLNTYQVDEVGFIDFPVLGKIEVEGKTINEAKSIIGGLLEAYLQAPSLNIRLINFKISVLGEVNNPSIFSIDSDRITLLEALGLAGDITPYGNIENILIVREQNGIRSFGEINLQSTNFIRSEFYYLKQGDMIYVEPRKDKKAVVKDNIAKYAAIIASALQVVVTVATIIILTNR